MNETELIAEAAAGDSDAFGTLLGRHSGLCFNAVQERLPALVQGRPS